MNECCILAKRLNIPHTKQVTYVTSSITTYAFNESRDSYESLLPIQINIHYLYKYDI